MNCKNQINYILQRGDNLYQLARHYKTSIVELLALNPGIDPYNLKIGNSIVICPGAGFVDDNGSGNGSVKIESVCKLDEDMREAWIQHVYWTRMVLISIAERLNDQPETVARLLKNPADIAEIFNRYYSDDVARLITALLTEHLEIGANLITALRDGETAEAAELQRQWYINADKMTDAFSSINPYYKHNEVKDMLYEHLELTTREVSMRLQDKYAEDIEAFNKVEKEALMMADYFTAGIIKQFPQKFA